MSIASSEDSRNNLRRPEVMDDAGKQQVVRLTQMPFGALSGTEINCSRTRLSVNLLGG